MKLSASVLGSGLLAVASHIPCCGPTIALLFGGAVGGVSWLRALEPYRLVFLGFSLVMLAWGFYSAYRKPHACHTCGSCSIEHHARRRAQIGTMWFMAAFVLISMIVNVIDVTQHGWVHGN